MPAARLAYSQQTVGATFGDVIKVPGGTPSDVVLDESRQRLYVTSSGNASLNVIDLTRGLVTQTVALTSASQGVEVGANGRALISMVGTGVVPGVPQGTLAVYDQNQSAGSQVQYVNVPALPTTPAPLPAPTLTRLTTTFSGKLLRTPDGSTLYSAFNTAATSTPPPPSQSSTLLVNDPTNLAIRAGIKLPESIVAKMVMTGDGSQAWGLSDSGLVHMPLGNLYNYPILAPQTTEVFLAMDDCNRGVATGATGNTAGNEGLQDTLLDEARGRLYITNSGYNRIEVFDTQQQVFLNPIPVGQMPHQMAMGTDGNTLYVGNTGGESIGIVDLNAEQVTCSVVFPPVSRSGTANGIFPRSLAMGLFGLQFLMSDGSQWEVVENTALPRPARCRHRRCWAASA
jgi:DNA-binding beta-propeller fold protein YncE